MRRGFGAPCAAVRRLQSLGSVPGALWAPRPRLAPGGWAPGASLGRYAPAYTNWRMTRARRGAAVAAHGQRPVGPERGQSGQPQATAPERFPRRRRTASPGGEAESRRRAPPLEALCAGAPGPSGSGRTRLERFFAWWRFGGLSFGAARLEERRAGGALADRGLYIVRREAPHAARLWRAVRRRASPSVAWVGPRSALGSEASPRSRGLGSWRFAWSLRPCVYQLENDPGA